MGLIEAEQDRRLARRFHIDAVRAVCAPREVLADMKTAGHGSLSSPWPAIAAFFARDLVPGR